MISQQLNNLLLININEAIALMKRFEAVAFKKVSLPFFVPQISYNPSLMRDSGNYVQVFPSRHSLVESLAAVIKQYGWSQIAVISEAKDIFLEVI